MPASSAQIAGEVPRNPVAVSSMKARVSRLRTCAVDRHTQRCDHASQSAGEPLLAVFVRSLIACYSIALPMSSTTFLASPKTIMVLSM